MAGTYFEIEDSIIGGAAAEVDLASTDYDATALPLGYARGIYIGGAGNVKVDFLVSGTVTYMNKPAGSYIYGAITKIYKSGTTATYLIAES